MLKNNSYWLSDISSPAFPTYNGEKECDILIIGAGLTGIQTAAILAEKGLKTIILEADKIASGTSGHTTAKITIQHGLKYHVIKNQLGKDKAMLYAKANSMALDKINDFIDTFHIDCDFRRVSSYVYSEKENEAEAVEKEYQVLRELDIASQLVDKSPLPYNIISAVMIENQAQFHPTKYIYGLIENIKEHVSIYEHSKVERIEIENSNTRRYTVRTNDGTIYAAKIVLGTNYPLMDVPGLYFFRLHQERSYIISTKVCDFDIDGMFINAGEPVNSLRMHYSGKEKILLSGGYGHRTGRKEHTEENYQKLKDFTKNKLKVDKKPQYLWSAQDCISLDHIPYIGLLSKRTPGIYLATGFGKWGMTSSMLAALLIGNSISQDQHPIMEATQLFTPQRFTPQASAKEFISHSANIVMDFMIGNLSILLPILKNCIMTKVRSYSQGVRLWLAIVTRMVKYMPWIITVLI